MRSYRMLFTLSFLACDLPSEESATGQVQIGLAFSDSTSSGTYYLPEGSVLEVEGFLFDRSYELDEDTVQIDLPVGDYTLHLTNWNQDLEERWPLVDQDGAEIIAYLLSDEIEVNLEADVVSEVEFEFSLYTYEDVEFQETTTDIGFQVTEEVLEASVVEMSSAWNVMEANVLVNDALGAPEWGGYDSTSWYSFAGEWEKISDTQACVDIEMHESTPNGSVMEEQQQLEAFKFEVIDGTGTLCVFLTGEDGVENTVGTFNSVEVSISRTGLSVSTLKETLGVDDPYTFTWSETALLDTPVFDGSRIKMDLWGQGLVPSSGTIQFQIEKNEVVWVDLEGDAWQELWVLGE